MRRIRRRCADTTALRPRRVPRSRADQYDNDEYVDDECVDTQVDDNDQYDNEYVDDQHDDLDGAGRRPRVRSRSG